MQSYACEQARVTNTCVVVISAFVFCWAIPNAALTVARVFLLTDNPGIVVAAVQLVSFAHLMSSVVNFFVFAWKHPDFHAYVLYTITKDEGYVKVRTLCAHMSRINVDVAAWRSVEQQEQAEHVRLEARDCHGIFAYFSSYLSIIFGSCSVHALVACCTVYETRQQRHRGDSA